MGAYSSKPNTETLTEQDSNGIISYGASSMQGWRLTQEDAHVALLDFDDSTVKSHFFAVFDGHGGQEVALYAAQTLPTWVKRLPAFKEADVEKALVEAFLSFDKHLTEREVIEQLKILAGDDKAADENDEDEELNEAIMLREEADLPIEQLLAKYGQKPTEASQSEKISKDEIGEPSAGSSGPSESSPTETTSNEPAISAPHVISNGVSTDSSTQNGDKNESSNGIDEPEKSETKNQEVKDDKADMKNSDVETSKKEGKGKQKKVIVKRPKRQVEPKAAYQQFLSDYGDEDDSSNDEEDTSFGPAFGSDSDSDEEPATVEDDDLDDEDDEEESDTSESEDDDGVGLFGFAPSGDFEEPGKDSGCTAVVAIIRGNILYVANAGDSRCVVSCKGKAIEMSDDHKPEDSRELSRIEKAGGKVTADGRVNGGLNLSRALGDHTYKTNPNLPLEDQMISPLPDVRQILLTPDHEFMVLACDGIWNSMTSQEVVDFVRSRLDQKSPAKICEELFHHCLAPDTTGDGTGCDNMTAIIVTFGENQITGKRKLEDEKDQHLSKKIREEEENASQEVSQAAQS